MDSSWVRSVWWRWLRFYVAVAGVAGAVGVVVVGVAAVDVAAVDVAAGGIVTDMGTATAQKAERARNRLVARGWATSYSVVSHPS